jgi:hypothetical protein
VAEQGYPKRKSKATAKSKADSKAKFVCGLCPHGLFFGFDFGGRCAHTAVDLPTPVHRLDFSSASGVVRRGLSEHVAAQQIVRVPQPRLLMKN